MNTWRWVLKVAILFIFFLVPHEFLRLIENFLTPISTFLCRLVKKQKRWASFYYTDYGNIFSGIVGILSDFQSSKLQQCWFILQKKFKNLWQNHPKNYLASIWWMVSYGSKKITLLFLKTRAYARKKYSDTAVILKNYDNSNKKMERWMKWKAQDNGWW